MRRLRGARHPCVDSGSVAPAPANHAQTEPSNFNATVCVRPATTDMTRVTLPVESLGSLTWTGVLLREIPFLPLATPSWPELFEPHETMVPSDLTATEWLPPAAIAEMPVKNPLPPTPFT